MLSKNTWQLAKNAISIGAKLGDSLTLVLVSTGIYAASMSMMGIILPFALELVPRDIQASALTVPLACLPAPHILALISQPALPCDHMYDL